MFKTGIKPFGFFIMILGGLLMISVNASAGDEGLKGWEIDSEYNKLYSVAEFDNFKGKIEEIKEIVPMEGMAPGLALLVRDRDDEVIMVHLGPKSFCGDHGLRKGDSVKIRGAWAEIGGEEVFLASKVKRGEDYAYKVRLTKDGKPFWCMGPDELAKERASTEP
jgi:hypothetical protein